MFVSTELSCLVAPGQFLLVTLIILSMFDVYYFSSPSDKSSKKCYNSFRVNKSTIIRTQDSKTEGAKYLDETDKPSAYECLKWCCETSNCSVAVYEEKKQGSCYLFDCGPVDKNLCKFTSYSNYTSAILTVNRHALELEQWSSSNEVLTVGSTKIPPTEATTLKREQSAKKTCGRNQFECRNDSTCIAIYNVCDGVYQCADRSDESDALGCPPDDEKTPDLVEEAKPKPTVEPARTTKEIPDQSSWKINSARESQGGDQSLYNQYQQKKFSQHSSASDNIKGIQAANEMHPLNIRKDQKQDSLFYHKGLDSIPPPESFSQSQYNRPNVRVGGSSEHHARPLYDNQDFVEVMKQPSIDTTRYNQRQNVYQDYYQGDTPVGYHKNRYSDVVQSAPTNNAERFNEQHQGYSQYQSPQYLYVSDNSKQVLSPDQYVNVNYPIRVYGRPPQQILAHRPVNNYAVPSQQIAQPSVNNNPENFQYPAEISNRHPARPIYVESSKDGSYIRVAQSLNKNKQKLLQEENYPLDKTVENEGQGIQMGKNLESTRTSVKSEPVHKSKHSQVMKETPVQSVEKEFPDSVTLKPEQSSFTSTEAPPLPKEVPVSKFKSKLMEEKKSKSSPLYEEINLSELEVKPMDASQSNGAYAALLLGLVLTGLLVVLVGCRLKVIRRRILHGRNGRSPLAHDADYLVNGMYL